MGKVGWKKAAKSTGWSAGTVTAVGLLMEAGIPTGLALPLSAVITGALNGLYQWVRQYDYLGDESE